MESASSSVSAVRATNRRTVSRIVVYIKMPARTLGDCPWPAEGRNAMLISEDYRQLAERCLRLAGECSDPLMADALNQGERHH